ncbi:transcriptional regulator GlxA family with amidase domain [Rhizobium leguminosarum]|uniref:Transcriptional regulator GlxA family with amidase domain n=1 Tax=Rhizobium leguminosarum TaxID=384 RepID=A0AAE2T0Q4_RHILE|nr:MULTISPECIES: GlxA family transcriptional regulator [Rhizobium]ARM90817.1 AraC family transcriptional regulator protein [Rhizobium sp. CIAT894]MBB4293744.1 transcriptional regulator GlxA family with amidase domain [Rhizobium leguminosarum]MBB4299344.1 transcriptional regulator GlxA family with amidase domain [Rhizobium leguminosarum]MBB4310843.1 transcriptional regulator GlxA family with amidase domain [Rhizobium leguminosarum]MBB4420045.1 transcriptional regulator GlxA family with amidase 
MKSLEPNAPVDRLKIGFVLAKSFTLSAFALFVDTLRLASDEFDRSGRVLADWEVLGSTRHLITSSCGVKLAPTSDFVDPSQFQYIIVVGGLLNNGPSVDQETVDFLKKASTKKVKLIGVCTGSFILAEIGLMKEHRTCVSWLHYNTFRERFPDHQVRSDRIFNLDRTRGSCAGGSSAADMAALIVRRHISKEAERNALEVLHIEKARTALAIQTRKPLSIECKDPRIRAVLIMMEQHIEGRLPIEELAASVGLSRRQLERLFMGETKSSPALVYRRVRMERAKQLLIKTKASLIEVALEVGFENASHFSRAFSQSFGKSPTRMRATELS